MTSKTFGNIYKNMAVPTFLRGKYISVGDIVLWEDEVEELGHEMIHRLIVLAKEYGVTLLRKEDTLVVTAIKGE